jgi:hypothetical protein
LLFASKFPMHFLMLRAMPQAEITWTKECFGVGGSTIWWHKVIKSQTYVKISLCDAGFVGRRMESGLHNRVLSCEYWMVCIWWTCASLLFYDCNILFFCTLSGHYRVIGGGGRNAREGYACKDNPVNCVLN